MVFYKLSEVPNHGDDKVFKAAPLSQTMPFIFWAIAAACLIIAIRGGLPARGRFNGIPSSLAYWIGGAMSIFGLLSLGMLRASLKPTNWLFRCSSSGIIIKYRSYLNWRLPIQLLQGRVKHDLLRRWTMGRIIPAIFAGLTMMAVLAVAANAPNPQHCVIEDGVARFTYDANDADLGILDNHPEITSITIPGMMVWDGPDPQTVPLPITDAGFSHLAKCRKLEELHLSTMQPLRVTDDGLKYLAGLTHLRRLVLGATPFTDAGIAHLAPLTDLQELWLDFNETVGDGSMAAISGMKNLRVLRFYGAKITDAGLAKIPDLTELEFLTLGKAMVTDAGLATIGRFIKLKTLDLQHTQISDEGMPQLKGLVKLELLALDGTKVSGKGLASIAERMGMKYLYIENTQVDDAGLTQVEKLVNLRSLYLSNTKVTDAGLAHLSRLTRLNGLKLNGLAVTDEGLKALDPLVSLKYIEINDTKVSAAGIAWLQKAHPNLEFPNRTKP